MSHNENSDDRSTSEKNSQNNASKEQSAATNTPHGWVDPSYAVGLGNFKYLFYVNQANGSEVCNFFAPWTLQPDSVQEGIKHTEEKTTNQISNKAGESAANADRTMNGNSTDNQLHQQADVEYIDTESHGRRAIVFSENFKLKATILNIIWKIDQDNDQRLSKSELFAAMSGGRFRDDEELIVCLLWRHFEHIRRQKISSSAFFDRRGVNVDEIMGFDGWARYLPAESLNAGTAKTFKRPPSSIRPHKK